ncbi:MAG: NHL repeat-containing protein, partial [Pyrinomonadaceae bacterium]
NVFVAFALVKLWNLKSGSSTIPTRVAAIVLGLLITIGGAIDLVPVWNSYFIKMKYVDDPLVEWARANTAPRSIFLSQKYINHQLLLAGRRLFYGDPYYAWSAGYDTPAREALAKRMFETRDANELFSLLKENKIDYVAIDDMVRNNPGFVTRVNEDIVAKHFPLVFTDEKREYANIKIYKVPEQLGAVDPSAASLPEAKAAPVEGTIFQSVEGNQPGQIARPRGIAVDAAGNIYVADTGNSRVQKFDAAGKFLASHGERGDAAGQLQEPNGVAIDGSGNIYVTDAKLHKLLRFKSDGQFEKEWTGPSAGNFYGPRDLAIGPNKLIYVIDQGGTRICKFDADSWTTWGSGGSGDGQFNEPSGITIGGGSVFVADANNDRVQVFDLEGKFVRQFAVPAWERSSGNYPDVAYDESKKLIYVTSGKTNEVLVFDAEGRQIDSIRVSGDSTFSNPSSVVIQTEGKSRRLLIMNTGSSRVLKVDLETKK